MSYIVKNALGTGYSPRSTMDGDAIDAVTFRNILLKYLIKTSRSFMHTLCYSLVVRSKLTNDSENNTLHSLTQSMRDVYL